MPMVKIPDGWVNPSYVVRLHWQNSDLLIIETISGREIGVRMSSGADRIAREIVDAHSDDVLVTGDIVFDPLTVAPVRGAT